MKECCMFSYADAQEALENMFLELVEDYGDYKYGNRLHDYDAGGRTLLRCKKCGAYVLRQDTEYHDSNRDDVDYTSYWPVSGPEEADELNRTVPGDVFRALGKRSHLQIAYHDLDGRKEIGMVHAEQTAEMDDEVASYCPMLCRVADEEECDLISNCVKFGMSLNDELDELLSQEAVLERKNTCLKCWRYKAKEGMLNEDGSEKVFPTGEAQPVTRQDIYTGKAYTVTHIRGLDMNILHRKVDKAGKTFYQTYDDFTSLWSEDDVVKDYFDGLRPCLYVNEEDANEYIKKEYAGFAEDGYLSTKADSGLDRDDWSEKIIDSARAFAEDRENKELHDRLIESFNDEIFEWSAVGVRGYTVDDELHILSVLEDGSRGMVIECCSNDVPDRDVTIHVSKVLYFLLNDPKLERLYFACDDDVGCSVSRRNILDALYEKCALDDRSEPVLLQYVRTPYGRIANGLYEGLPVDEASEQWLSDLSDELQLDERTDRLFDLLEAGYLNRFGIYTPAQLRDDNTFNIGTLHKHTESGNAFIYAVFTGMDDATDEHGYVLSVTFASVCRNVLKEENCDGVMIGAAEGHRFLFGRDIIKSFVDYYG